MADVKTYAFARFIATVLMIVGALGAVVGVLALLASLSESRGLAMAGAAVAVVVAGVVTMASGQLVEAACDTAANSQRAAQALEAMERRTRAATAGSPSGTPVLSVPAGPREAAATGDGRVEVYRGVTIRRGASGWDVDGRSFPDLMSARKAVDERLRG